MSSVDRPSWARDRVAAALAARAPEIAARTASVAPRLERVLAAFAAERLGVHHFASVSGYGHGDLGREHLGLRLTWRMLVMKIEATFPHRHDLGSGQQVLDALESSGSFMGMDPDGGPDAVMCQDRPHITDESQRIIEVVEHRDGRNDLAVPIAY